MADHVSSSVAASEELSRFVLGEVTLGEVLTRVSELAVGAVDPADVAGITLVDDRDRPLTAAFTDPASPEVDEVQYRTGRGPCLDSMRARHVVRLDDACDEARWPEFAVALTEHGLRSVLSTPLILRDRAIGGLNLYARSVAPFGPDAEAVAAGFAAQAAVVLANAQEYWGTRRVVEQLTEALASRDLIGQAKGVVMATEDCDADTAFDILRTVSQRANRKLTDVAADVVRGRGIRT